MKFGPPREVVSNKFPIKFLIKMHKILYIYILTFTNQKGSGVGGSLWRHVACTN